MSDKRYIRHIQTKLYESIQETFGDEHMGEDIRSMVKDLETAIDNYLQAEQASGDDSTEEQQRAAAEAQVIFENSAQTVVSIVAIRAGRKRTPRHIASSIIELAKTVASLL